MRFRRFTVLDLRSALHRYDINRQIADVRERMYANNPQDEDAERKFDQAYENEMCSMWNAVGVLMSIADIDEKTAKAMVVGKRDQLDALLAKAK